MPVSSTNFSISGWGTGSAATFIQGTQRRCEVSVLAGTSPSPNPIVTFTFPDYKYPSSPLCFVKQNSFLAANTGEFSDVSVVPSPTQVSVIYIGIPLASKVYIFIIDTLGV